jgi:hypothetical protein
MPNCREHRLCRLNCPIDGLYCNDATHRPKYDHVYGSQDSVDRTAAFSIAAKEAANYIMGYRYGMGFEDAIAWASEEFAEHLAEQLTIAKDAAAKEQALDFKSNGMHN